MIQPYDTFCVDPEKQINFHTRVTKFGVRTLMLERHINENGFKYIAYQTYLNGIPQLGETILFSIEGAEIMVELLKFALEGK